MPMREADALLRLVIKHPNQDGPRLIYSDWLDERRDPRGEFIRAQCALARMTSGDLRREELQRRAEELLRQHQAEWVGPLKGLVSGWQFQRGFVEAIFIEARRFLAHGERVFALAPIRRMHLLDIGGRIGPIAASPLLGRLTALTVFASHLGDVVPRALALSQHLGNLEELNLGRNRITDAGAAALAVSPTFTGLTSLDVSENEFGEAGAHSLAAATTLGNLNSLNVSHNGIGTGGANALLTSNRLSHATALRIASNRITHILSLDGASELRRLRLLDLSRNLLDGDGIAELARCPHLLGLHTLNLSHNVLGDAGAGVLADSPYLAGLRTLLLSDNRISDAGVRLLANSPHLAGLTTLKLANNPIGDGGVHALIDSPFLRRVRRVISED
jgi:uncharacterized protein (TIGR02996 family)